MNKLKFIFRYILYLLNSKNKHHIHSPFVFELVTQVINVKSENQDCNQIEQLRKQLCETETTIKITDFGAGYNINLSNERKIKDIAKNSAKSAKFGKLLYRIVKYYQPQQILELGTSLGISTSYLAKANQKTKIYTFEGCPQTAAIAKQNFNQLDLNNINLILGNFDDVLKIELVEISSLDLVFIDGNHQKEPTLNYFKECLKYANNDTIFIFDDIHWSDDMQKAWKKIQRNASVSTTIDLFFVGIVFIKKELSKEHFVIRF